MAIQRTQAKSDLERKFKLLEYQLYGKKEKLDVGGEKLDKAASNIQHLTSTNDIAYLKQDLTKIFILASIAITTQVLLYFGLRFQIFKNILI